MNKYILSFILLVCLLANSEAIQAKKVFVITLFVSTIIYHLLNNSTTENNRELKLMKKLIQFKQMLESLLRQQNKVSFKVAFTIFPNCFTQMKDLFEILLKASLEFNENI